MEVWILLAAAGSGYLAKRLQNLKTPKESSEGEVDDKDKIPKTSTSNHGPLSSRGPSHQFSSSSGRLKRVNTRCGKDFSSRTNIRKCCNDEKKEDNESANRKKDMSGTDHGNIDIVERADEKIIVREMDMLAKEQEKITILERDCKKTVEDKAFERCLEGKNSETEPTKKNVALHPLKSVEGEKLYGDSDQMSMMRLSESCGRMGVESIDDICGQGKDVEPKSQISASETKLTAPMEEMPAPSSTGLLSGVIANDDDNGTSQTTTCMDGDGGYTRNNIKDNLDSVTFQDEDSVFGKTWMPGFWDVAEGVFVLDTESLLIQHDLEGRNRGNSSSRRSRTPNKYGKRKILRKKSTGTLKPMSSLESCLSAQMDDYNRKNRKFEEFRRGSSSYRSPEKDLEEKCVGISTNKEKIELSRGDGAIGLPFLSPRQPHPKKVSKSTYKSFKEEDRLHASNHGSRYTEGPISSSSGGFLFNFGVGIGMMYAIISYMQKTRRLNLLLKEAESLTKDLETDLKTNGQWEFRGDDDTSTKGVVEDGSFMNNSLTNVRSVSNLLHTMKMFLSSEAHIMHTKDMSKLEAELVAELDRMELNWDGDSPRTGRKSSGSCELVGEVGSLVQGELRISGLPHEYKEDSKDGSVSSHEDLHANSFAVSPRDLARRLYEVLETRQEARISELESGIKFLGMELIRKDREIEWLKDQNENSHRYCNDIEMKESSLFKNDDIETKTNTPTYIALGGEALAAYMEACNQLSNASDDLQRRSDKDELAMERAICGHGVNTGHMENCEGLEHVDLVSLAEDLYVNGDPMYMEKMPHTKSSRKRSSFRHPQPEHLICTSRGFDSSDDATNETSGSTPCSVKCIDFTTNKEECSEHNEANDGDLASCLGRDEEWRTMIDRQDDYEPDFDEQLGDLLIKRIVEKSRKGSHIVRDASLILESFEYDE